MKESVKDWFRKQKKPEVVKDWEKSEKLQLPEEVMAWLAWQDFPPEVREFLFRVLANDKQIKENC